MNQLDFHPENNRKNIFCKNKKKKKFFFTEANFAIFHNGFGSTGIFA
jgi:hypothetical protein